MSDKQVTPRVGHSRCSETASYYGETICDTCGLELFAHGDTTFIGELSVPSGTVGDLGGKLRRLVGAGNTCRAVVEANWVDAESSDTCKRETDGQNCQHCARS